MPSAWEFDKRLKEMKRIRSEHSKTEWKMLKKMWKLGYPNSVANGVIKTLRIAPDPALAEQKINQVLDSLSEDWWDMFDAIAPIVLEAAGVEPVNKETDMVIDGMPVYTEQFEQTWSELDLKAIKGIFDDAVLNMLGVKLDREKMSLKEQIEIVKAATIARDQKRAAEQEE